MLLEEYITHKERHTVEENREDLKSLEDLEPISDDVHKEKVKIDGDEDMFPEQGQIGQIILVTATSENDRAML